MREELVRGDPGKTSKHRQLSLFATQSLAFERIEQRADLGSVEKVAVLVLGLVKHPLEQLAVA